MPCAPEAIAWLTRFGTLAGFSCASYSVTPQPMAFAASTAEFDGTEELIEDCPPEMTTIFLFLTAGREVASGEASVPLYTWSRTFWSAAAAVPVVGAWLVVLAVFDELLHAAAKASVATASAAPLRRPKVGRMRCDIVRGLPGLGA